MNAAMWICGGIASAICLSVLGSFALAALSGAGEGSEEAEPTATPARDDAPICAWCRPGIDHPAGHTICAACSAREMERVAAYQQTQSEGGS